MLALGDLARFTEDNVRPPNGVILAGDIGIVIESENVKGGIPVLVMSSGHFTGKRVVLFGNEKVEIVQECP